MPYYIKFRSVLLEKNEFGYIRKKEDGLYYDKKMLEKCFSDS